MATTPNSKEGIELLETVRRKRAALEARLRKVPYRVIADDLGVSVDTVRYWVREMTQTILPQEEAVELRAQEANALDESESRILAMIELCKVEAQRRADNGDGIGYQLERIAKFEEVLEKVRNRRSMLLGLNVPVAVKHQVTVRTEFDAEVESLVADLSGGGDLLSGPDMVDVGDN